MERHMNKELQPDPWIASPAELQEQAWEYCRIRHFPGCGDAFRASHVRLDPGDEAKVVSHQRSAELVCVLAGEVLALAGERKRRLGPHDVVFLPKNTAHAFAALGGEAVLLVVHAPASPPNQDHLQSAEVLLRPQER